MSMRRTTAKVLPPAKYIKITQGNWRGYTVPIVEDFNCFVKAVVPGFYLWLPERMFVRL
jgi:hypothetical protein